MAAWDNIEVRAIRVKLDGSPASGYIRFKPSPGSITHTPSNSVIVPADGKYLYLKNGEGSVSLPATDDPDMDVTGWTYQIFEVIEGKALPVYSKELPLDLLEEGLDLVFSSEANNPGNYQSLVTRSEFDNLVDEVDALEVEAGGDITWDDVIDKPSTFPPSTHTHDDRYYTESETTSFLSGKADSSHTHEETEITNLVTDLSGKAAISHIHDDRYYTESEITALLIGKSDTTHNHDTRYYTESEIDVTVAGLIANIAAEAAARTADIDDLSGVTNAGQALANIGGQPLSTRLTRIDQLTLATGDVMYLSSAGSGGVWNKFNSSSDGRSLLGQSYAGMLSSIGAAASVHDHDDRYYTETEINSLLSAKVSSDITRSTPAAAPSLKITVNYDPASNDSNLMEIFTGASPDSTNWTFRHNESGLLRTKTAEHQLWDASWRAFRRDSQTGNIFELVTEDGNTIVCNIMPNGSFVTSGVLKPGTFTTAGRPSASTSGERSVIYDTDIDRLCVSDGTQWLETMVVSPWTTITSFGTNKTADSTRIPQGTKRGDFTELCGRVNTSDGFTQSATVLTLPAALWPAQNVRRDVSVSTGVVVTVQINSADGTIVYNGSTAPAATYLHLDGIKWRNY